MIKRKLYLHIQNDGYIKCYNKKGICEKIFTSIESIKDKKLVVIFETRDVLVKEITFPRVKKSLEYSVINNEIAYEIGKSDDIIFDYDIYGYSDKKTDAIVYCLRYYSDKIIRKLAKNNSVAAMYSLPILILNCIKFSLQEYLVLYKSIDKVYIMACFNDYLVCFYVFDYFDKNDLSKNFMLFISEFLDEKYKKCQEAVYFINFDTSEIMDIQKEKYRCYDIGKISADEIISKINSGGKMKRFDFIPCWYKEYERNKKIRTIKLFIILFATCDFLLVSVFIYFYNRCSSLMSHSLPAFSYDDSCNEKELFKIKSRKVINNLDELIVYMGQSIMINEAFIKPEDIKINASVKDIDKYYDFINYIENSKGVHIKNLSVPSCDKGEITFDILLEAKN